MSITLNSSCCPASGNELQLKPGESFCYNRDKHRYAFYDALGTEQFSFSVEAYLYFGNEGVNNAIAEYRAQQEK